MALFRFSGPPTKKRVNEDGQHLDATGGQRGTGSQGTGQYGLTTAQVEELAVRTAQVLSIHDVRLREFGTLTRRVRMPVASEYGKVLVDVDTKWKVVRRDGGKHDGSKHLRLAVVLLGKMYQGLKEGDGVRQLLETRWAGKDTRTPEFLGTDVRTMKWRTLKNRKEGVLEFMLVPELAGVERELLRVLTAEPDTQELFGMESKGPQIDGTWRRG